MKKIKFIIVAVSLFVLLTSCASSSSIVGHWKGKGYFDELEFFGDGTYVSDKANYSGSYSVDGNRLRLSGILMSDISCTFKVNGDTLILYDEDGSTDEYKRVND